LTGIHYQRQEPDEAGADSIGLPDVPYDLFTIGTVVLNGCDLICDGTGAMLRLWHSTARLTLNDCFVYPSAVNDTVPVGWSREGGLLSLNRITARNNAVFGQGSVIDPLSDTTYGTVAGGAIVTVVQDEDDVRIGTVALDDTTGLQVGDLVRILPSSPNKLTPPVYPSSLPAFAMDNVAICQITEVVEDTSITLGLIPQGFPFGVDVRLGWQRWVLAAAPTD